MARNMALEIIGDYLQTHHAQGIALGHIAHQTLCRISEPWMIECDPSDPHRPDAFMGVPILIDPALDPYAFVVTDPAGVIVCEGTVPA